MAFGRPRPTYIMAPFPNLYQLLVFGAQAVLRRHETVRSEACRLHRGRQEWNLAGYRRSGNLDTGHDASTYGGELDLEQEVWPLIEYMKTL